MLNGRRRERSQPEASSFDGLQTCLIDKRAYVDHSHDRLPSDPLEALRELTRTEAERGELRRQFVADARTARVSWDHRSGSRSDDASVGVGVLLPPRVNESELRMPVCSLERLRLCRTKVPDPSEIAVATRDADVHTWLRWSRTRSCLDRHRRR